MLFVLLFIYGKRAVMLFKLAAIIQPNQSV